jgi:hypothetical protein
MVRWVAFDDDTAEAVVTRLRRGAAEINHSTPVDAALQSKGSAVVVLPASTPGRVLIARFFKRKDDAVPAPANVRQPKPPVGAKKGAASTPRPWWRGIGA